MKVHSCGDRALLVEVDDIDAVLGVHAALTERPPVGVTELTPAARTVLVRFDPALADAGTLARALRDTEPAPSTAIGAERVVIPVVYDGADLAHVAEQTGLGVDGVVEAHTAADYVVAFCGFAPGFGYLSGLDPRLHVPRRSSPRTRVLAGSVGIAGEFTGIYPQSAPGGWQLLGHTDETLWDQSRCPPALLCPGAGVRFVAVSSPPTDRPADTTRTGTSRTADRAPQSGIEVRRAGPRSTVQDLGRPGMASLGVSPSGAADRRSAALANRLVGNPEAAACLELTLGGAVLLFHRAAWVTLTGAPCPVSRDGPAEAMNAPFDVRAGQQVTIGPPSAGVYTYLAVRGGIAVQPTLGSRATDMLSGLGPAVLTAGARLPIGAEHCGPLPAVDIAPVPAMTRTDLTVHILPGPRDDWFTPDALRILSTSRYMVSPQCNRIGARLDGPALTRSQGGELPSEGIVAGAVQVPPSGQPVVLLADHPVTGGYPVIAVVLTDDLPLLAQARPGQGVRFRLLTRSRSTVGPPRRAVPTVG